MARSLAVRGRAAGRPSRRHLRRNALAGREATAARPNTPTKKIFLGEIPNGVPFSFLPACGTRHSLNESTDSRGLTKREI